MTRAALPPTELRRAVILLTACLALCAIQALTGITRAAELILHGPSLHYTHNDEQQNLNFGLGYIHDNNVALGAYRNSENSASAYLGYFYSINHHVGVIGGVVSGYQGH